MTKYNTIKALEQKEKTLKLIVLLVVYILLLITVRFLYTFIDYIPKASIVALLSIVTMLVVITTFLIHGATQEAIRALNEYSDRLEELMVERGQKEMRMRAVIDSLIYGIITIDEEGIIESFNPGAEKIFGYGQPEIIGMSVKTLMPPPYHFMHDEYIKDYMAGAWREIIGGSRELSGRRRDGETFPLYLSVSQVNLGDRLLYTGIVQDITEVKKAERLKDEFVSTVSHEVRTPVTSIMGSLGIVSSGMAGETTAETNKIIDIAYKNCKRLLALINDILDTEKIRSGKMQYRIAPLALEPVLEQVVEALGPYAGQFGVRLMVENPFPGAKVNADSERLMQVLTNLLSNAVKYSPQEDTVRVSVSQKNGAVRVSVTDHGAGVPEGFGDRIFHEFAQVDSTDRRGKGGTGLGLYISKKIIEDHGGHISYDSEPGVATTFYFDLPGLAEPGPSEEEESDGLSAPWIDDLTGLMDRPRFEEELNREWKRTARSGLPLSLILVEVDYFELYDSTYGQRSGQECLRMLARALREAAMRSSDLLARYGNAQYAALLPETDAAGAAYVADKIRSRAETLAIEFVRPRARGIVTVSTGTATVRPDMGSSPSVILTAAEKALLEAKENG